MINKIDVGRAWDLSALPTERSYGGVDPIWVSALVGTGVDVLTQGILRVLGYEERIDTTPSLFTARQRETAAEVLSDLPHHREAAETAIMCRLIVPSSVTPS